MELPVQPDRMIRLPEAAEQANHATQEGSARPDHFGHKMEVADQGFELPSVTPAARNPREE